MVNQCVIVRLHWIYLWFAYWLEIVLRDCLDRMRDRFRFVKKWSSGDIGNIVSFSRTTEAMVWKRDLYVHFKVLDRSCYFLSPSENQNRCQRRSKFASKPYVKQHFHGLLEKHWTEFNHTWQRCSLLCPTKVLLLFMLIRKKINKRRMCPRTRSSPLSAKWA